MIKTLTQWAVISTVVVTALLMAQITASAQVPITKLTTTSDPGDYIGGSGSHSFTPSDGPFFANASSATAGGLADTVEVNFHSNNNSQRWELTFSTRAMGKPMTPGFYDK